MPLVSSANRGYTVSPHDLKAHGLEGHGWYGRVRQGGTERVFGRQLLSLGGAQILFFAPKRGEKIKESQIEGGGRVGCGRPWQRLREGGGAEGARHCQFWSEAGPTFPDQPHSEKRPTELGSKRATTTDNKEISQFCNHIKS